MKITASSIFLILGVALFLVMPRYVTADSDTGIYPINASDLNSNLKSDAPWASITGKYPTGLYAPSTASCSTSTNCELIDAHYVTSCVVYDFKQTLTASLLVNYTKTGSTVAGDSCESPNCGEFPGVLVYSSPDKATWNYLKSLPDVSRDVYREESIEATEGSYRYVAVCRGSGSHKRDNVLVKSLYAESQTHEDAIDYYAKAYLDGQIAVDTDRHKDGLEFNALAMDCSVYAEGYKRYNNLQYRNGAIGIANFLRNRKDRNNNGLYGWGLEPDYEESNCGMRPGENDAFRDGTCNPQDTEHTFQTSSDLSCILDVYEITGDESYLNVVIEIVEDWWNLGTSDLPGCTNCFYYLLSPHPNDANGYVRNLNMLMGGTVAKLYAYTKDDRYKQRALAVLRAEEKEITSGSRGYYSIYDQIKYPTLMETEKDNTNNHHIHHARMAYNIGKFTSTDTNSTALNLLDTWSQCTWGPYCKESDNCTQWSGNIDGRNWSPGNKGCQDQYTFSHCFFRNISSARELDCLHELNETPADEILGQFQLLTLFTDPKADPVIYDMVAPSVPTGLSAY